MKKITIIIIFLLSICSNCGIYAENTQNVQKRLELAKRLYAKGEQAKSLLITNSIIDSYSGNRNMTHSDSVALMNAAFICGNANMAMGNATRGLTLLKDASNIAKSIGNTKFLAQAYNSLFSVYFNTLDFSQALDLLTQAIELSKRNGDRNNLTRLYNNKGLTLYAQHKYNEALDYMLTALDNTLPKENYERAQIYTNIAEVYYSQDKYTEAEQWLSKALKEMEHMSITAKNIQPYLNLALVKAKNGKEHEARHIQKIIYRIINTLPLPMKVSSLRQLADINICIGDSISGLRDMLVYDQLADSLQKIDNNSQMRQLLVAYDAERLSQHNAALKDSLHTRTIVGYASLVFLLLVSVFSVVIWKRMREDKRKSLLIAEQKDLLLKYEQEEHERQQKMMRLELEHKSRQLTSYTIDLAAVNDFHQKIGNELEHLLENITAEKTAEARESIKYIENMLTHFNDKPLNDDFRIFFEEVHPEYLKKLSRNYPKLSENDLRLCAYIFLGMSTKEIAALTYHEVRSIESSRNRLRKKLDLEAGADVKVFLLALEERFNSML